MKHVRLNQEVARIHPVSPNDMLLNCTIMHAPISVLVREAWPRPKRKQQPKHLFLASHVNSTLGPPSRAPHAPKHRVLLTREQLTLPLVAPPASRMDQLAYAQCEGATDAVSFPVAWLFPSSTETLRCFPSTAANADGCPPAPSIGCMPHRAPVTSTARTPGPCPGTLGVAPKSTSSRRRFQLHHPSVPPPSLLFLPSSLPQGRPRC